MQCGDVAAVSMELHVYCTGPAHVSLTMCLDTWKPAATLGAKGNVWESLTNSMSKQSATTANPPESDTLEQAQVRGRWLPGKVLSDICIIYRCTPVCMYTYTHACLLYALHMSELKGLRANFFSELREDVSDEILKSQLHPDLCAWELKL